MELLKKYKWWAIVGGVVLLVSIASASSASAPSTSAQSAAVGASQQQPLPTAHQVTQAVTQPSTPSTSAQPAAVGVSQQQTLPTAPQAPQVVSQPVQPQQTAPTLSNDNYYTNSSGNTVHSPAYTNTGSVPAGSTAQCGDGTYSFSQHRSGTCSHHGGVAQWL